MSSTTNKKVYLRAYDDMKRVATAVFLSKDKEDVLQVYPEKKIFANYHVWTEYTRNANPGVGLDFLEMHKMTPKPKEYTPEQAQVRDLYRHFGINNSISFFKASEEMKRMYPEAKVYKINGVDCFHVLGGRKARMKLFVEHDNRMYPVYCNTQTGHVITTDLSHRKHFDGLPPCDSAERRFWAVYYRRGREVDHILAVKPKV